MIIAIDGPAGSGKSSTAKAIAQRLEIVHLDTGAMYRAVTLKCLRNGIAYTDIGALRELMSETEISFTGSPPNTLVWLDGEDVTDSIRSDEVTRNVSDYCAPRVVRDSLVATQRKIGNSVEAVVCEGRDIGTVVFPNAEYKFFMVASAEERAKRRQKDFEKLGIHKSIEDLISDINERDEKDSTRSNSPLRKANDAIEIDTTNLTFKEQVDFIIKKVKLGL